MAKRKTASDRPFPRARKRYGQHFLEPAWVAKLINAIAPRPDETFLEIGPGRGALTLPLASKVARLIAVEIDRDLTRMLQPRLPPHVYLVEGDVLDLDLSEILQGASLPIRVAGNLPYNISSPILFKLLHAAGGGHVVRDATLMLQREVADRLIARPGSSEYGTLALQVALRARVELLLALPPGAFRPPPKVTSAVVRLAFHPPAVDVGDPATFERLVRGMFLQRRKTLANALLPVAASLHRSVPELIERSGVDPRKRPGDLTLDEAAALSRAVL